MSTHQNPANNIEKKIDATLRLFAQAQPPVNLEQRIHTRLHRETASTHVSLIHRLGSFFLAQRIVFASVTGGVACCAIVIGSVQHSRQQRTFPVTGVHVAAPSSGLGAASGARIAPQPVPAPENGHSRSERKTTGGRATVQRDAHKAKGVAVPESTEPAKP